MPDLEWGWRRRLDEGTIGLVEVDALHPFHRFYGLDNSGHAQLVFLCEEPPPVPPISELVAVSRGRRTADGLWALSLTVADDRFTDIFVRLGTDLALRAQTSTSSAAGLDLVMVGLDEWRQLLNPRRVVRLSDEQLRGLVGEVWVAINVLGASNDVVEVVEGWLGPFGNPQDFILPGRGAVEVKSVRPGSKTVRISSADQLDAPWTHLELLVVALADAELGDPKQICLTELAAQLRRRYIGAGRLGDDVDLRFRQLGVDLKDEYYASRYFHVQEFASYDVLDSFPSIRSSRLDPGVRGVTYEIERASLHAYLEADHKD